jgi:hypothetical protein
VSHVLLVLDSAGAKMLMLEEIISEQLEAEGHVLAEKVAEHVLTCFQSYDSNASLEPVVQGPTAEAEEIARANVQDTAKIVATWFQHHPKDA